MPLETTTPKPTLVPAPRIPNPPPASPYLRSRDRHPRRPSTRRSFSSAVRSNSFSSQHSEIHRTLCAHDHDSFSYDSDHLREWYMPQDIWDQLPQALRDSITSVQNAGAAILTGFERLEDLKTDLVKDGTTAQSNNDVMRTGTGSSRPISPAFGLSRLTLTPGNDQALSDQDDTDSLPPMAEDIEYNVRKFKTSAVPALDRGRSDSAFSTIPPLDTSAASLSFGYSPSPPLSGRSTPMTPMSPLAISRSGLGFGHPSMPSPSPARSGAHSPVADIELQFQLPVKPLSSYYRTEVLHLKSDSLVRLRHAARKVDVEILEAEAPLSDEFINWWVRAKEKVEAFEHRVSALISSLSPGVPV